MKKVLLGMKATKYSLGYLKRNSRVLALSIRIDHLLLRSKMCDVIGNKIGAKEYAQQAYDLIHIYTTLALSALHSLQLARSIEGYEIGKPI